MKQAVDVCELPKNFTEAYWTQVVQIWGLFILNT